jgi:hypothetical protein
MVAILMEIPAGVTNAKLEPLYNHDPAHLFVDHGIPYVALDQ